MIPSKTQHQEYIIFGRKGASARSGGERDTDSSLDLTGPKLQYSRPRRPDRAALSHREAKLQDRRASSSSRSQYSLADYTARTASPTQSSEFEPRRLKSEMLGGSAGRIDSSNALRSPLKRCQAPSSESRETELWLAATASSNAKQRSKHLGDSGAAELRYTTLEDLQHAKELERGGWMGDQPEGVSGLFKSKAMESTARAEQRRSTHKESASLLHAQSTHTPNYASSFATSSKYTSALQAPPTARDAEPLDEFRSTFSPTQTEYHVTSGYLISKNQQTDFQQTQDQPTFGCPSKTELPAAIKRLVDVSASGRKVPRHLQSSVGLIMGSDYRMPVKVPRDIKSRIDEDRGLKPALYASGTQRVTNLDGSEFRPQKRSAQQIMFQQSPFFQNGVAAGRPSSASKKHTSMLEADAIWMRSEPVRYESME